MNHGAVQLPRGWRWSSLGKECEVYGGGTPKRDIAEYFGGEIPWATPTDVTALDSLEISQTKETITTMGLANSSTKLLPKGAVLLTSRATIGFTAIAVAEMCTNQGFANFVCKESVTPEYLAYWLPTQKDKMLRLAGGTTFKEISRGALKKFPLPVAPQAEQRRIVDILKRADSIRRLRKQAIQTARELIPALFVDMFGDPATNPKGWPIARFGDLAEKMSDGPFGSNLKTSHYTDEGVRVIRLQNIGVGNINDTDKAYVSEEHFAALSKHRCLSGDVIIGTLGDPNLRAIVLPPSIPEALNKADCVQFRCNPSLAVPEYICWLMNMPTTLRMASQLVQGITRTRISMGRLRELHVPMPALSMQLLFAERVEQIRSVQSQQVTASDKTENSFSSFLHHAFRGEL